MFRMHLRLNVIALTALISIFCLSDSFCLAEEEKENPPKLKKQKVDRWAPKKKEEEGYYSFLKKYEQSSSENETNSVKNVEDNSNSKKEKEEEGYYSFLKKYPKEELNNSQPAATPLPETTPAIDSAIKQLENNEIKDTRPLINATKTLSPAEIAKNKAKVASRQSMSYFARGNTNLSKGKIKEAFLNFTQAINLDPKNYYAYVQRAVVRFNAGDHRGSLSDANQAIKLFPNGGDGYLIRGCAKRGLDDWPGAEADLNKAKKLGVQFVCIKWIRK